MPALFMTSQKLTDVHKISVPSHVSMTFKQWCFTNRMRNPAKSCCVYFFFFIHSYWSTLPYCNTSIVWFPMEQFPNTHKHSSSQNSSYQWCVHHNISGINMYADTCNHVHDLMSWKIPEVVLRLVICTNCSHIHQSEKQRLHFSPHKGQKHSKCRGEDHGGAIYCSVKSPDTLTFDHWIYGVQGNSKEVTNQNVRLGGDAATLENKTKCECMLREITHTHTHTHVHAEAHSCTQNRPGAPPQKIIIKHYILHHTPYTCTCAHARTHIHTHVLVQTHECMQTHTHNGPGVVP